MDFKKAFTKLGLVEDDIQVAKPVVQQAVSQQTLVSPIAQSIPTPLVSVDPSISAMLNQSLQDNKLAGFDYLKFISAVEEMKSTGTPEDARYKMAFFTAKQLGVDKANLLKSGEHYLDVLKQDENDFNTNCAQRSKSEIQGREAKIAQIEETITNLSKQLAQLQQDHSSLKQELESEKSKLETMQSAFQLTLQNFRSTIESNIQKINQYLS